MSPQDTVHPNHYTKHEPVETKTLLLWFRLLVGMYDCRSQRKKISRGWDTKIYLNSDQLLPFPILYDWIESSGYRLWEAEWNNLQMINYKFTLSFFAQKSV